MCGDCRCPPTLSCWQAGRARTQRKTAKSLAPSSSRQAPTCRPLQVQGVHVHTGGAARQQPLAHHGAQADAVCLRYMQSSTAQVQCSTCSQETAARHFPASLAGSTVLGGPGAAKDSSPPTDPAPLPSPTIASQPWLCSETFAASHCAVHDPPAPHTESLRPLLTAPPTCQPHALQPASHATRLDSIIVALDCVECVSNVLRHRRLAERGHAFEAAVCHDGHHTGQDGAGDAHRPVSG